MAMIPNEITRRRILVVEDDPSCADSLARVLESAGYEIEVAGDLAEARAALSRGMPDLITLDLELGKDSGANLLVDLRSNPQHRAVPVLLISGVPFDHEEVRKLVRAFGVEESLLLPEAGLQKPVRPDRLLAEVAAALR
ncbi:MAG: response regulator [Acidobacteria bacterium]|jgi:DNA-binding response OmpR family regulator|nr:response regulator [Acidobacteriota bacterium]